MSKFWSFKNLSDEEVELRISGEIISDDDAWIYEWFGIQAASPNAFRQALAEHKGKDITVWIDSWGGDVFAGAGMYNAIKEHDGKVTAKIDGKAVSAASVVAMAADEILMSPVSIMMIHNPYPGNGVRGDANDLRRAAAVLDEVKETIMNAYQAKTGLSREKISSFMDETTWMSARKAVSEGFADGILYGTDAEDGQSTAQNAYSFSMLAIQNSADNAMRRFFDGLQNMQKKSPKDYSKYFGNASESCICDGCNHGDNCQSSGAKCCICSNCDMATSCSKPGAEGCQCKDCSLAQNNCCQPGTEKCMCDSCANKDTCGRGQMGMDSGGMENKLNNGKVVEDLEIKNLDELKQAYPDLCNQLEAQAMKGERERIKDIDEIATTIPPELVNEAKYDKPVNAQQLALAALKADASAGRTFLDQRQQENNPANKVPGGQPPAKGSENEAAVINSLAEAMKKYQK